MDGHPEAAAEGSRFAAILRSFAQAAPAAQDDNSVRTSEWLY